MKKWFSNKFIASFLFFLFSGVILCSGQSTVTVATWNLQHFGRTKKDSTIDFIARTVGDCDVIAVQEVVGVRGGLKAVRRLTLRLNEVTHSKAWRSVVSKLPSGTSNIIERYAFLWRSDRLTLIDTAWLDRNYTRDIEREPYLATFNFRGNEFTLVNFHAVPKRRQPEHEIKYLKYFPARYPNLCLIFLGDFNCPQSNNVFNPLKSMGYKPVLEGQKTTLRMECVLGDCLASEYDNIFYPADKIQLVRGGIIPFFLFCPDMKKTRKISDHVPVIFEFTIGKISADVVAY